MNNQKKKVLRKAILITVMSLTFINRSYCGLEINIKTNQIFFLKVATKSSLFFPGGIEGLYDTHLDPIKSTLMNKCFLHEAAYFIQIFPLRPALFKYISKSVEKGPKDESSVIGSGERYDFCDKNCTIRYNTLRYKLFLSDFFSTLMFSLATLIFLLFYFEKKRFARKAELEKMIWKTASEDCSEKLAFIGHDIRAPIDSLLGLIDHLEEKLQPFENERHYLGMLTDTILQLKESIEGILSIAAMDMDKKEVNNTYFSVNALIKNIIYLFSIQAKKKGIDILFSSNVGEDYRLFSDKLCVRQIISNLIGNAIKYSSSGPINVEVLVNEDVNMVLLKVKDKGIGIDDEKIRSIFEKFYQTDLNSKRKSYGIGLYLSMILSRKISSDIEVKSVKGEGSEFTLTVPITTVEKQKRMKKSFLNNEERCLLAEKKILFIDDNEINIFLLKNLFKDYPRFVYINDPRKAIIYLKENCVDMIITDIHMAPISGHEILIAVKRDLNKKNIKIYALTSDLTVGVALKSGNEDYQFDGVLSRPIDEICLWHLFFNSN